MGCCSYKRTESLPRSSAGSEVPELLFLTSFVNQETLKGLKNGIDEPILTIENIRLNVLAFCLVSGNFNNFVHLIEKMNASTSQMESLLEQQGFNGLDIIIEKGCVELLAYYFPIYQMSFPQRFCSSEELETSDSMSNPLVVHKPPVHIATERGNLQTLKYLHRNLQGCYKPDKYNIHYIDDCSGENSALIACKKCFLPIVKFLYEECKADFSIKTKRLESALHLAAFGSKNKQTEGFEVILYLVEVVKIDIGFQYEEVLLILNDFRIIEYFEGKLKENGIFCTKEEVEKKYSISSFGYGKNRVLYGNAFEFTCGGMSSIDVNLTVNVSVASFFQDLDSEDC